MGGFVLFVLLGLGSEIVSLLLGRSGIGFLFGGSSVLRILIVLSLKQSLLLLVGCESCGKFISLLLLLSSLLGC